MTRAHLKIKAQLMHKDVIAFGPGKADLLDAISETGSISGAARAMGMSYRRAWLLVEAMNRSFRKPLVEASRGGDARGGARVTAFGISVLTRYRTLQRSLEKSAALHMKALTASLAP